MSWPICCFASTVYRNSIHRTFESFTHPNDASCNSFAAELLLPSADFDRQLRDIRINEVSVERLANRYCVSREAVMRRLLDKGLVSQELYEEKAAEWAAQAEKKDTEGGNYYATQ